MWQKCVAKKGKTREKSGTIFNNTKRLCPIGSAQGGRERLEPAVSIAPASGERSPGAGEAPSSADRHASRLHLARRES